MAKRDAGDAWAGKMTWRNLLFAHWPVRSSELRPHVPALLDIDEFDGTAWIAVAPFSMTGMRLRGLPCLPGLSHTLELNVRTYVRAGGLSGVWFFSLDAASWPAVIGARAIYHLNYRHAQMSLQHEGGRVVFRSRRTHPGSPPAELQAWYQPVGAPFLSKPGSLEHWLTERYALFAANGRGTLYRGDIQHPQWQLQTAAAEFEHNSMTAQLGLELPDERPLLHFAKELDVLAWLPDKLEPALR